MERFNPEAATGGAQRKMMFVKNPQIHRKTPMLESLFYQQETQMFSCEFVEILNNSFFCKSPRGGNFC